MKKDRGKLLTVMCVISAIGAIQSLYGVINPSVFTQVYKIVPSWLVLYVLGTAAVNLGVIVGILMLKKWGVYLLFAQMGVGVLVEYLILKPAQIGPFTIFSSIASAALWFWVIYRKWKNFE